MSRPKRWADAVNDAAKALDELRSIQEEYEDWMANVPDNLQETETYPKLEAVCSIDIEGAIQTVEEADGADLPLGFGRD